MIELLTHADAGTPDREIVQALSAHCAAVLASAARGRPHLVASTEALVRASPNAAFSFDPSGLATLRSAEYVWQAGRFRLASIGELRAQASVRAAGGGATFGATGGGSSVAASRVSGGPPLGAAGGVAGPASGGAPGRLRLWVIDGSAAPTDIGSLQAHGAGTLFQVASQFNCLEATEPKLTPVARYLSDPTQGPRAAVSAFPGTLLRHYAAPDGRGGRFVQQNDGPQLDLLRDVCDPAIARVRNGYLMAHEITDARAFASTLEARFEAIQVGVHEDVEVVLGYDWAGEVTRTPAPLIDQALTSTLAAGVYGSHTGALEDVCLHLLCAAYLGTLLAAVALGRSRVVLTLIGGGAFGNPLELIWQAIAWALDHVAPLVRRDLTVVVNARDLGERMGRDVLLASVRAQGGALLAWPRGGAPSIHR